MKIKIIDLIVQNVDNISTIILVVQLPASQLNFTINKQNIYEYVNFVIISEYLYENALSLSYKITYNNDEVQIVTPTNKTELLY